MLNALRKINRILRAVAVAAGCSFAIFKLIECRNEKKQEESR